MNTARLKPKEERRLLRGHLWAYRNEFANLPGLADGEVVDVLSDGGRFIGRGFYQAQGGIAVRIAARHQVPLDGGFLHSRIGAALAFRETLLPSETTFRWVFGESDGLPGLVADRYGSMVSVESSCAFYAARAEELANVFLSFPGVEGVWLRLASATHQRGRVSSSVVFTLNGLHFTVDLEASQKTGMFLDQRLNCVAASVLARGTRVLDGHCYAGLWSCHAARAGASQVLGVDTSAKAIEQARANAEHNGLGAACSFECADIMHVLQRGERYGLVILDPPALAKSRAQAARALPLYQALNRDAMNAVEAGGYLVTSSCSHFVDEAAFLEVLKRAAASARRNVWILERHGPAPDHPILLAMPETAYLKCVFLRVL